MDRNAGKKDEEKKEPEIPTVENGSGLDDALVEKKTIGPQSEDVAEETVETETTLEDLYPRRFITVTDIGRPLSDIITDLINDGIDPKTGLTEAEEKILNDLLFAEYAEMEFMISKLKVIFRSISSNSTEIGEHLAIEILEEKNNKVTQQENIIINIRLSLAKYLLVYGDKNFKSKDYETIDEMRRRYEFIRTLNVTVLDHLNKLLQRFVRIQERVLDAETITNF